MKIDGCQGECRPKQVRCRYDGLRIQRNGARNVDHQPEAVMSVTNRFDQRPSTTGVLPYGPEWRRIVRGQADNALRLVVVAVLFCVLMLIVNAKPVFSQVVELLKVDVAVVAKGHRISKLLSSNVVNEKNEKVGTLDDVVVDRDRNLFAILQVGGFLGINSHLVAVPYQSLVIDDTGRRIELPGASRDELKKLAEFRYRE
jgi:sporulation protein YlmC with PRC-barrel domain